MTNYVASLFLPVTLDFQTEDDPPVQRNDDRPAKNLVPVPNLISTLASRVTSKQQTPPATPPSNSDRSDLFFQTTNKGEALLSQVSQGISSLSERLHATLGLARPNLDRRTTFNQPLSRASSPPQAPIVVPRVSRQSSYISTRPSDHQQQDARRGRRRKSSIDSSVFANAPWSVEKQLKGNGGLRNAVEAAALMGNIKQPIWVGLLGLPTDQLSDVTKHRVGKELELHHNSMPVYVPDNDFEGHYSHFSKKILWPMFHYQIPDNPKSKVYEDHSWNHYVAVNQHFADKIVANYKRGDTVWINDYHLLLLPRMIRQKIPHAMIGFFLHIAFPSSEVFRCLGQRSEILDGMLGSNVIGFQTDEYCRQFLQTCARLLYVEATPSGVQLEHSFVNVISLPIGIDPISLKHCFEDPEVQALAEELKARYEGKALLVGRDKLDHVKGVRQKLLSYERFLQQHPEWRDKVILIQVALPTNGEHDLQSQISDIVSRINSRFGNISTQYQPIIFLRQDISFSSYLALLSVADCLLVTSLREGMNLTSHEYIFCQQKKKSPLILSEFVGSSDVFGKDAIIVNPWDYRQTARAIASSLTMSTEEKEQRWSTLNAKIMREDGANWASTFIAQIQKDWIEQRRKESSHIPKLSVERFAQNYKEAKKRLFFIDYEGTLIRWGSPQQVVMSSAQIIVDLLNVLVADPRNIVYITSERTPSELERSFRRIPGIGLVAENGCFLRPPNGEWHNLAGGVDLSWRPSAREILQYYAERTPGSFVEEKNVEMVFHYARAENTTDAQRQVNELTNHINDSCAGQSMHARPMDGYLVIEAKDINKGTAAAKAVSLLGVQEAELGYIMVFGNDRADEEIFSWANDYQASQTCIVLTVSVGARNTEAKTYVPSPIGVTTALTTLANMA